MFALTQQSLHQWEALCTQDQPPYCTARCPLHVDGKGLCAAVEKGNFTKGREILEKYMVLPRILSAVCEGPCRSKCRRQESGEANELQRLEQASQTKAKHEKQKSYHKIYRINMITCNSLSLCEKLVMKRHITRVLESICCKT